MMEFNEYFKTPVYVEEKPEWVDPINKVCDGYIEKAKELNKEKIKKQKGSDFGGTFPSHCGRPEAQGIYYSSR